MAGREPQSPRHRRRRGRDSARWAECLESRQVPSGLAPGVPFALPAAEVVAPTVAAVSTAIEASGSTLAGIAEIPAAISRGASQTPALASALGTPPLGVAMPPTVPLATGLAGEVVPAIAPAPASPAGTACEPAAAKPEAPTLKPADAVEPVAPTPTSPSIATGATTPAGSGGEGAPAALGTDLGAMSPAPTRPDAGAKNSPTPAVAEAPAPGVAPGSSVRRPLAVVGSAPGRPSAPAKGDGPAFKPAPRRDSPATAEATPAVEPLVTPEPVELGAAGLQGLDLALARLLDRAEALAEGLTSGLPVDEPWVAAAIVAAAGLGVEVARRRLVAARTAPGGEVERAVRDAWLFGSPLRTETTP